MQEPLIKAILNARAGYFIEQRTPAPTAGYPAAVGPKIPPENGGDMAKTSAGQAPATGAGPGASKIGVLTGTFSQAEEDFRSDEQVAAMFPARVKAVTYPDNFSSALETVIAQLVGLAADPDVKVIIVAQAVPGSVAAARKIREQRPDILIGFVGPHEDPDVVNEACDIATQADQITRGTTIIE